MCLIKKKCRKKKEKVNKEFKKFCPLKYPNNSYCEKCGKYNNCFWWFEC